MTALSIPVPAGFSPRVNVGDTVVAGQVIAESALKDEVIINIPKELSIKRTEVKKVLRKNPGDQVEEGDVIAVKKGFLGQISAVLKSSVKGTIIRYERDTGNLFIRNSSYNSLTENLLTPVAGQVVLCNNSEIAVSTEKNTIVAKRGVGATTRGEIFVLGGDDVYYLNASAIGKIVVGRTLSQEILLKGIGIGVGGIIGINIHGMELLTEKKYETPVMEIDDEKLKELISWHGKNIYMNVETKSIILLEL